jgi:hypothetical protein
MPTTHTFRRRLILAAAVVGFAAAMVLGVIYGIPYKRHWGIQRDIAAFKAHPTQANAEAIVLAIYRNYRPGAPSVGKTEASDFREAIEALLDLKAILKPSYAPNTPIDITLASGNDVVLEADLPPPSAKARILFRDCSTELHVGGLTPMNGDINSESVQLDPSLTSKLRVDGTTGMVTMDGSPLAPKPPALVISKPGIYPGTLYFIYSAQPYSDIETTRDVPVEDAGFVEGILVRLGLKSPPIQVTVQVWLKIKVDCDIRVAEPAPMPAVPAAKWNRKP